MAQEYEVKVSGEDIERVVELACMNSEIYSNDSYANGVLYTLDWVFQLNLFEFDDWKEKLIPPPIPLDFGEEE